MEEASIDLVDRWRNGDQEAANELFHRYASRLVALAETRLSAKLALRANAEDVVQSAYRSFFVQARAGRYVFERSGDLWRLLVAITLHKVRRQIEVNTADKRSVHLEKSGDATDWLGLPASVLAREPSPEEATALTDEIGCLMSRLEPVQRRILELRLQGHNVDEIAADVGLSSRSVKRGLQLIRHHLEQVHGAG